MKAIDDVAVKQVTLVITDENEVVIEQGAAQSADGLWWVYTTTAVAKGQPKVIASAVDLLGHVAKMVKWK